MNGRCPSERVRDDLPALLILFRVQSPDCLSPLGMYALCKYVRK
jgi:hypothetical protein